jgi:GT2 family glycosyltransferase
MPNAVEAMIGLAERRPKAGLVGAQLLNADGTFQASHVSFPNLPREFLILSGLGRLLYGPWYPSRGPQARKRPEEADYVIGACILVKREAFENVGGMDEDFFMYAEEVDLCYAMKKKGWEVWYQPAAAVLHLGSGSSRDRKIEREADLYAGRVRFFRKHHGNRSAGLLKLLIYGFTTLKRTLHGLLLWLSAGNRGRRVVSVRYLLTKLRNI